VSCHVSVIGDALLDVRATPEAAARHGGDAPARIALSPGGQGANVAVRLARQEVPVELVAGLGADSTGALLRAALETEGVRLREVAVEASGCVVVLGERGGERTMLSQRAPFSHLVPAATAEAVAGAPWVVVSGYVLHEPAALELAATLGASPGRRVLLGCAVPEAVLPAWRTAVAALRPDLAILNRDEARRLGGVGAEAVAVTDAVGAMLTIGGMTVSSVTAVGAPARDTTGAGDAFAAALIAGLRGASWPPPREVTQDAVEAAVALAGRVVRAEGAQARVAGERAGTLPA
jgi:sugar/nucleoside kinase (ribokinase family)